MRRWLSSTRGFRRFTSGSRAHPSRRSAFARSVKRSANSRSVPRRCREGSHPLPAVPSRLLGAKRHKTRNLLLDGGGPKGRARAAMSCRKSETKLSSPHEQSIPSACRILGPPFRRRFRDDKSARKNLLLKIPCNPLISLDSDERIQGNPSFSNPQNLGFSQRNGTFQENPNRVDERRRVRRREGAKPTPSRCTAV